MPGEKDRLGDKLREVERGREDHYFSKRDEELLEKMRKERTAQLEAAQKSAARMRCPKCGELLIERMLNEILVDECPSCGGLWLDEGELEKLNDRDGDSWIGRLFRSR
jgi:predicted RNA-binding Zn-ribbon protein involved in translation (DUF1610 family)